MQARVIATPISSTPAKIDPPNGAEIWVIIDGYMVRARIRRDSAVLKDFWRNAAAVFRRYFEDPNADYFTYKTVTDDPMVGRIAKKEEGVFWTRGWDETSRAALLAAHALARDT